MPVEIKELHIKVTINEPSVNGTPATGNGAPSAINKDDRKTIISQSVEQVMEIFNNKKER